MLVGTVVTMNDQHEVLPGARVFLREGKVEAIARAGEPLPAAAAPAVVVESDGLIYPGLIDLHNHPEFNALPLWVVPDRYPDRYRWLTDRAYRSAIRDPFTVLSAREYLDLQAELGKYAELKAVVAGTTAIQGAKPHDAYSTVEYLVRNVEYTDVGALPVRAPSAFPGRAREAAKGAGAWLVHLAEGTSPRAREEFARLRARKLILPQLVGIHSLGLSVDEFGELARVGGKMVWSPLGNYLLYGEMADVRAAKAAGVLMALGPDWSPAGSKSVLGELKVADLLNRTRLGGLFSDRELVEMVTRNPAVALGWGAVAGRVAAGFLGDLVVIDRVDRDPYRNLILATETHVQLVVIRGEPVYGDEAVMQRLKTYGARLGGSGAPDRRYEPLDPKLTGPRRKAVDFLKPGIAKGALSAADVVDTLARALRFDRTELARRIPAVRVRRELAACPGAPAPANPPSRADFERFLECEFPGALREIPLDPPVTTLDDEFFRRLDANRNLPPELKRLREYYRPPG